MFQQSISELTRIEREDVDHVLAEISRLEEQVALVNERMQSMRKHMEVLPGLLEQRHRQGKPETADDRLARIEQHQGDVTALLREILAAVKGSNRPGAF